MTASPSPAACWAHATVSSTPRSQLPGPGRLNRSRPRPSHSPEARLDLLATPDPRRDIGWMSPGSLTALVVPGATVQMPSELPHLPLQVRLDDPKLVALWNGRALSS